MYVSLSASLHSSTSCLILLIAWISFSCNTHAHTHWEKNPTSYSNISKEHILVYLPIKNTTNSNKYGHNGSENVIPCQLFYIQQQVKTIKHEAYLVIAEKLFIAVVVGVFGVVSVHSSSAKKKKKKDNNWQIPKSGRLSRKHNKSDGGSEREGQIRGTWKHNNTERERERGRNTQATVTNRATRTYVQAENELEKRYWQAQISIHSLTWGYMDPIKV